MSESLSLPGLFSRALSNASKTLDLPTIGDETQNVVSQSLADLKCLRTRIIDLSLFSQNETLEDIPTRDLVYLLVPYIFSEVQNRVRTHNRGERMDSLVQTQNYTKAFVSLIENYSIVPEEEITLYSKKTSDPARRRELKINQFKKERDLKTRIQSIRKRRAQKLAVEDLPSNFDLIASLLPPSSITIKPEDEIDPETDEILRSTSLLLLRLTYAQAHVQLESMDQELELLRNAPPSPTLPPSDDLDERSKHRNAEADSWKLDVPLPTGGPDGKGPLLDHNGKPLRPFMILPSDAGERARLQATVFGPGHNLPTMTVDEYLQVERNSGNIITGGGPASEAVPTSSEQLAINSEMDGTLEGNVKTEEKRQKDENWARFTDENPRGAGNTMNRG